MADCSDELPEHRFLMLVFDENLNGEIEAEEVQKAEEQWKNGNLTVGELQRIYVVYNNNCKFDVPSRNELISNHKEVLNEFDTSNNGSINLTELQNAINRWSNDRISHRELAVVKIAWKKGIQWSTDSGTEDTGDQKDQKTQEAQFKPTIANISGPESKCPNSNVQISVVVSNQTSASGNVEVKLYTDSSATTITENITLSGSESQQVLFKNINMPYHDLNANIEINVAGSTVDKASTTVSLSEFNVIRTATNIPNSACSGRQKTVSISYKATGECNIPIEATINGKTKTTTLSPGETGSIQTTINVPWDQDQIEVNASIVHQDLNELSFIDVTDSIKVVRPEASIQNKSVPSNVQPGNEINLNYSVKVSNCSSETRIRIVDTDTGNILAEQTKNLNAGSTGDFSLSFNMPPEVVNAEARIAIRRSSGLRNVISDSFRIEPKNAVIIRTDESIDIWGGSGGTIESRGFINASSLSSKNLESNDKLIGRRDSATFNMKTPSDDRDSMIFSSLNNFSITTTKEVVFAVDGKIKGKGTQYILKTGIVGTFGALPATLTISRINPSDREIRGFLTSLGTI